MSPPLRLLLPWALVMLAGLTAGLGSQALREPDEGRNAEVAREMAESNDYALPRLNGQPYLDKPVFFFAAAALSIELFGASVLAVRATTFLFFLATVLLIGWFGRRQFGPAGGWIAMLTSATMPLMVAFSRTVIMDSTLCFFVVLSLICFYYAVEGRRRVIERRLEGPVHAHLDWRIYSAVAWAAIAIGILVKGPVALIVPLMVALPYSLWRRAAFALWHPAGPALAVLIAGPWVWMVERELPGFLRYVALTETVSRMASDELKRSEPFWYFGPVLLAGAFPWSLVALSFLWPRPRPARDSQPAGLRHSPEIVYLLLWLCVPVLFFTLSKGKMPQYILPLLPSIGLLIAAQWSRFERPIGTRLAALGWALFGVALLVALLLRDRFDISPELAPHIVPVAVLAGVGCLVAGLVAWRVRKSPWWTLVALSIPMTGAPLVLLPILQAMANERSGRLIADTIETDLETGAELFGANEYSGSLSFYLERTYPVWTHNCEELRSNYLRHECDQYVIPGGQFRPDSELSAELERCEGTRIFITDEHEHDLRRSLLDGGLEEIIDTGDLVAYRQSCPASP